VRITVFLDLSLRDWAKYTRRIRVTPTIEYFKKYDKFSKYITHKHHARLF